MAILIIFKDCIEPRIKTSLAIPIDFSVVILTTLISWQLNFDKNLNVNVVGDLPTGLPQPSIPRVDLFQYIVFDCLIMALVSFAVSFSLAKILAKNHRYDVRANQELFALGSANAISSFFNSFPASAALSRSTLQERMNGRTQITTIFSCIVILNVVLFFALYLYYLPEFALSIILIVAIRGMLKQFKDFWEFWFISKLDAISWLFTFLCVIFWDIDTGLIFGIIFSLHIILYRLISPSSSTLGCIPSTEIYVDIKKYRNAEEINGIKIFRFCSPIFYLSNDTFKDEIFGITHTDKYDSERSDPNKRPKVLIIDMSCVNFIDKSGANAIVDVIKHLQDYKVVVCLVCCPAYVIDILIRTNFFDKFDQNYVFPTIQDAVISFK